jgi:hypothetical protein
MAQTLQERRLERAQREFNAIITPEILEEAELLHKQMSYVPPEEMFKPFTM